MFKVFLAFAIFVFGSIVQAQDKPALSLEEAVALALKQNPEILAAQRQIDQARGRKSQAFSLDQPELSFRWEKIPSGGSFRQAGDRIIGIGQNLEFPPKLFLKRSAAGRDVDIAFEDLGRVQALVTARVKKAYYQVFYQQKILESLEFTSGLLQQFQEATLSKYQAGSLAYFEVVRARVEAAKTQNEIIAARAELVSARTDFNLILGRAGSEDFELTDKPSFALYDKSKEETVRELLQKSRSLKIAQLAKEREGRNLQLARWGLMPDLKLEGGFGSEAGGDFRPSVGIGFSLPLWWWGPKGAITENRAAFQVSQIRETALNRILSGEIERAYTLLKAAENQLSLFEKSLLKEVDEELKAGINAY
ncbi:MAG: TolC family protein, partial [Limisphaerales bacterium]